MKRVISSRYIRLLLAVTVFPACVGARERGRATEMVMQGKIDEQRWESSAYFVRITCIDEADKVIDGRFVLEPPYSYKVYPGKNYRLTLQLPDGRCYDGYIQTIAQGGSYGKYPGYEICFDVVLQREVDSRGTLSFTVQSPKGERVLRITMSRR